MSRSLLLVVAASIVGVSGATYGQGADKPDLAKAQQIVSQVCAACHGNDGNSALPPNPHLAGQHAEYITRQLKHFKEGVRHNEIMAGMSASLTDADMKALGTYFGQQTPKPGTAQDAGLAKAGQSIYRGGDVERGLPACAGCHSPNGAGIPANYPRLAGQLAEYTYAQLKLFKEQKRGVDKAGTDVNGLIMAQIAAKMTDTEMRAVAEYIAGLY